MKKYSILFIAISIGISSFLQAQKYIVPAKLQWVATPVNIHAGEQFEATAKGTWTNGGANPQFPSADGWTSVFSAGALAPNLPIGALIAKVGDQVFLMGSNFKGKSPAAGQLFLAMNDDDFSDNDGAMNVTLALHRIIPPPIGNRPNTNIGFVSPSKYLSLIQSAVSDGKVQLSQTGEGVPLSVKNANGATISSMSYLSFGTTLNALGMSDIDIPLPNNEWSPEQIANTGGLTVFAQYLITGSVLFADRFRFQVNNVHAFFGSDLNISLGNNEILLNLSLKSPDPSIRGEGNGYTGVVAGIPIPLGWEDDLCPDIDIRNFGLTVHLVPIVAGDGTIHFNNPVVDLNGDVHINNFDWLPMANDIKNAIMQTFKQRVENAIRQPNALKGLEAGFLNIIPLFTGRQNINVTSIQIDKTGILLHYK